MSRRELTLLVVCVALSGIVPALMIIYNWDFLDVIVQRAAPVVPVVPPPDGTEDYVVIIPEVVLDEWPAEADGGSWIPLSRLDQLLGAWQTSDGRTHVLLASRTSPGAMEPGAFWLQPFRLTVAVDGSLAVTCGLYDSLEGDDPSELPYPWRLGYCRPPGLEGPSLPTRVRFLQQPNQEFIRLMLGVDIDIKIYQSP